MNTVTSPVAQHRDGGLPLSTALRGPGAGIAGLTHVLHHDGMLHRRQRAAERGGR